ncbi:hypothetical protein MHYP_G00261810 [Metynnis hypsauchen]
MTRRFRLFSKRGGEKLPERKPSCSALPQSVPSGWPDGAGQSRGPVKLPRSDREHRTGLNRDSDHLSGFSPACQRGPDQLPRRSVQSRPLSDILPIPTPRHP